LTREIPPELAQVIYFTTLEENIETLASHGIRAQLLQLGLFEKVRAFIRRLFTNPRALKILKKIESHTPFEKLLVKQQIDLVYFLAPSGLARDLEEINFITTVWDLCHRDDLEFPEVRWNREFETRDKNYLITLPRATAVIVDSERGRSNVVKRYGIDEERIHVMPFQAAISARNVSELDTNTTVAIHNKYQLDIPYIFYPAQFWPHKNHIYILEGLKILEDDYGMRIGAIFSGGDQGNLQHVKNRMHELGLNDRVRFAGFVENEEIPHLYRQSIALVMPTYFGPTNLPPLEAFSLGVPVLYSDKAGLRDQVGKAGLLMDLTNPKTMADHIKNLTNNAQLRKQLIRAGHFHLASLNNKNRIDTLYTILKDFYFRRLCWDS